MPGVLHAVNGAGITDRSKKRSQAVLNFVTDLLKRLPTVKDDPKTGADLLTELHKQTQVLGRYAERPDHGLLGNDELDRTGTDLWNLCTRLNRESDAKTALSPECSKLILASRVIAYQILHLCQWSVTSPSQIPCHLMKLALKAAKVCTDGHEVQTARFILQRAADYQSRLQQLSQTTGNRDVDEHTDLEAEWTAMRMALAWQDDQLEIAEHTFAKADGLLARIKPSSAEKVVDSLFQIGKGLLSKQDFLMAEKWLQRAWDIIIGQQLPDMSRSTVALRMAIVQALVTALLGAKCSDSVSRAQNLIEYVESEVGDQPIVLLLNLEMLSKSPGETFDSEAYGNILRRMIRSFQPTEANFKILGHHIHILHAKSPGLGCIILDEFLSSLVRSGQSEWVDRMVTTRIHMATSHRDFEGAIEDAKNALSRLEQPVSPAASFAAQTLIWKKIEANYTQNQFEMAEKWCHLALSRAFESSGPTNKSKMERKLLLCALARNNLDAAKASFYSMTAESQKDPTSQYLLYKASIRSGDTDMATECLENLAQSNVNFQLLYACVADAQRVGDRLVTLQAMKKLAAAYDYENPGPVHLPALLRCTVMVMHNLLKGNEERDQSPVIEDLCQIFDNVVLAVKRNPKGEAGDRMFDIKELEWFCQLAYNLGLKHAGNWHLRHVVRILNACIELVNMFPTDVAVEMATDLSLRTIFCNFLISSALVALARSEDSLEQQLQDYLILRRHVLAVDREISAHVDSKDIDEVSTQDLLQKLAQLLAFDFEAAVALKQYQELSEIVLKARQCQNAEALKGMADCALRANMPSEELFGVLRRIINQISELDDFDPSRLAKYSRCLFQTTLPLNEKLGTRLLDETCKMVKDAHNTPAAWPTEEIEWFASVAFNHSIDLVGRGESKSCPFWAQAALKLAHHCDDQGQLEALIQENLVKFNLDAA